MRLKSIFKYISILIIPVFCLLLANISEAKRHRSYSGRKYSTSQNNINKRSDKYLEIDKKNLKLHLKSGDGKILASYSVAVGRNKGQKQRKGDHRTPEGKFKIIEINPSSGWSHDFKDGKGERKGAYGPWFFRLNCPQSTHIGIHGTCFPEQTGKRSSDGCIRMKNNDIQKLKPYVYIGMPVIILSD